MNLQNWKDQAKAHWKEFQPKRFKALQAAGKLDEALESAANQTYLEVSQLEASGFQPDEAFQMVRESYLFPPEESQPQQPATSLTHEMAKAAATGQRSLQIG